MSKAMSALNGMSWSEGIAEVREIGLKGMITLRGDLASAAVKKAVKVGTALDVPEPRHILSRDGVSVAWMSPDELLVMCPYSDVAGTVQKMQRALGAAHGLVQDVSDARAVFHVKGICAREVLAKLAPVDLHKSAFPIGAFRRTRLAQVAGAFHMRDEMTCEIVCFRSVGQYVFDILKRAAQANIEVDVF